MVAFCSSPLLSREVLLEGVLPGDNGRGTSDGLNRCALGAVELPLYGWRGGKSGGEPFRAARSLWRFNGSGTCLRYGFSSGLGLCSAVVFDICDSGARDVRVDDDALLWAGSLMEIVLDVLLCSFRPMMYSPSRISDNVRW